MSSFKVLENDTGLQVTGLRKSYRKRIIIHDISLELRRGEVVALLGPNGSGKTTTFYSIAGLTSSDGGPVKIDGMDVTTMPMYRRARMGLSYLPQETSIFRGLNVEDNIKSILDISTPLKSERQAKLEKLLSDFRIEHLRRTPALALSGGERRRVAGVDPISVNDVRNLVSELKSRSIGVLITDHNVRDTLKIVDRAYILHDGRVIVSGLPEDVVNNDNVRRVYLGNDFNIL